MKVKLSHHFKSLQQQHDSFCPNLAVSHLGFCCLSVASPSCQSPSCLPCKTCPGAAFSGKLSLLLPKLYYTCPFMLLWHLYYYTYHVLSLQFSVSSLCIHSTHIEYLLCTHGWGFRETQTHLESVCGKVLLDQFLRVSKRPPASQSHGSFGGQLWAWGPEF